MKPRTQAALLEAVRQVIDSAITDEEHWHFEVDAQDFAALRQAYFAARNEALPNPKGD